MAGAKKNKKKNNINLDKKRIFWLALVLVAIITIIIILALPKNNGNNNKMDPNPTSPTQEQDQQQMTMPDYYTIINYLNLTELPDEYFGYFYKKDSYTSSEISNKVKVYMGIRKVIANNPSNYEDTSKKQEISSKDVEKSVKEIFGKDTKITHESLGGNSTSYSGFKYNNNKYTQTESKETVSQDLTILSQLKEQVVTEEKAEITVSVIYVGVGYDTEQKKVIYSYYNDQNKEKLVTTSDVYSISGLEDKVSNYKFTFVKTDGKYVFEKVEKIN